MKKTVFLPLIILISCIVCANCFSQNIKCETIDYAKKIENKEYSTYQYVNASYSSSRPLLVIITDEENFKEIHLKIPSLFKFKQEYTDINLLGIKDFNVNNILIADDKIIHDFTQKIIKYRIDNDLPVYSENEIRAQIHYLEKPADICKFLICK